MKQLTVILTLWVGIATNLFAQTCPSGMTGKYKVGPTGKFISLTQALDTLKNRGVSDSVFLELQAGYTTTAEAFPLVLPNMPCASLSRTITIRPEAGATNLEIASSDATTTLFLNHAQYYILDGRSGGTGTAKNLTISNAHLDGNALRLENDASFNQVKHLKVRGVNNKTYNGVIYIGGTNLTTGNDYNRIDTCEVFDGATTPTNAIFANGTDFKSNTGLLINGCSIYNFFNNNELACGVLIASLNDSVAITNNHFYQTAPRNFDGFRIGSITAIDVSGSLYVPFVIANNYVGGSAPFAGGERLTLTGQFSFTGISAKNFSLPGRRGWVQGNTITNLYLNPTGVSSLKMIKLGNFSPSTTFSGYCEANNIGSGTKDSSIWIKADGAVNQNVTVQAIGIDCTPARNDSVTFTNNTISSFFIDPKSANRAGFTGIYIQPNAKDSLRVVIRRNTIGSTTRRHSIYNASLGYTTGVMIDLSSFEMSDVLVTENVVANMTSTTPPFTNRAQTGQLSGVIVWGPMSGRAIVSKNSIHDFQLDAYTGAGAGLSGICSSHYGSADAEVQFTDNRIFGLYATYRTAGAYEYTNGILIMGDHNSKQRYYIRRNLIHSLRSLTPPGQIAETNGIYMEDPTSTSYLENNMIRLGLDTAGQSQKESVRYYGIHEYAGTSHILHNTVIVEGTGVKDVLNTSGHENSSAALYMDWQVNPDKMVRNNIFVNNRREEGDVTNHHSAIEYWGAASIAPMDLDYNLYYTNRPMGYISNYTTKLTLDGWKQHTGKDAHSFFADPNLVSPTGSSQTIDLHLKSPSPAEGKGSTTGTTPTDFDNELRIDLTPVDIGADATGPNPCPAPTVIPSGTIAVCEGIGIELVSSATTGIQWYRDNTQIPGATQQKYPAFLAGNYSVRVTPAGCSSPVTSNVVTLQVDPLPPAPTITATGSTLTASTAANYQWYLNGTFISGARGQTYEAKVSGTYTVTTFANGCLNTSAPYNLTITSIVDPAAWNRDVVAYPVPADKQLYIRNTSYRKLQLQLSDAYGKVVKEQHLSVSSGSLDLQALPSGLYLLRITDVNKKESIIQTVIKR